MNGLVVKGESGNLVVNSIDKNDPDIKTQQGLTIAPYYMEKFNLVEGDKVSYNHGDLYSYIKIEYLIKNY